jgi:hypothetical protein
VGHLYVALLLLLQLALQAKRVAVLGIKTEDKVSNADGMLMSMLRQYIALHSRSTS